MTALRWLPQGDRRADIGLLRQTAGWNEGVVQGVQRQRGHPNAVQVGLGRGAFPVVIDALEAVEWPGKDIVKRIKITGRQQGLPVEQARVLGQLLQRLGHHGVKKHAGVDLPVEPLADGPATGGQVQRRAD